MPNNKPQSESIFNLNDNHKFKVSRSEAVLQHLKQLLIDGKLSVGDELPSESELARVFEVSKPIVREALRKLEVMSIITIRRGKPPVISSVNAEPLKLYLQLAMTLLHSGLAEAIELRRALELHAVSLAAAKVEPDDLKNLRSIVNKMSMCRENTGKWVKLDIAFHIEIARLSGNVLFKFMIEALESVMSDMVRSLFDRREMRDSEATVDRHRKIVEAIAQHDPVTAQKMMNEHFNATIPVAMAIAENIKRPQED